MDGWKEIHSPRGHCLSLNLIARRLQSAALPSSAGVFVAIIAAMAGTWVGLGFHFARDAYGLSAYGTVQSVSSHSEE
jgi:hypothetical protein